MLSIAGNSWDIRTITVIHSELELHRLLWEMDENGIFVDGVACWKCDVLYFCYSYSQQLDRTGCLAFFGLDRCAVYNNGFEQGYEPVTMWNDPPSSSVLRKLFLTRIYIHWSNQGYSKVTWIHFIWSLHSRWLVLTYIHFFQQPL